MAGIGIGVGVGIGSVQRRRAPRVESAPARVEEIRLQNFRAFENARLKIDDLTMLVGRNGAGKSSLLDAVDFIREAVTDSLPNALDRRDGLEGVLRMGGKRGLPLGLAVVMRSELPGRTVRLLYGFRLQGRRDGDPVDIEEKLVVEGSPNLGFWREDDNFLSDVPLKAHPPEDRLVLPLIAGEQLWKIVLETLAGMRAYEIGPQAVAAGAPIQSSTSLVRHGDNAGDVLEGLRVGSGTPAYEAIIATLKLVTPGVVDMRALAMSGRRQLVFYQEGRGIHEFRASQVSQGTLRAVGILLALHQSPEPSLVLIDEIEDSIHPRALEALLEAVEDSSERFPVVVTTHSPEVLSKRQALPERIRILQWTEGVSHLYGLSQGTVESIDPVTSVGDLLRFNGLWPAESPECFPGDLLELGK
jgi:predicted ATPase